jgi:hypothetical protein
MLEISHRELIELVDDTFEEFLEENYSPVDAAHNTIFEVAKPMVNNSVNQFLVYKRLIHLLEAKQEVKSNLYQDLKQFITILDSKINSKEKAKISDVFIQLLNDLEAQ